MVYVQFLRETHLPRFTMKEGQEWRLAERRLTDNGFALGGGWVEHGRYSVLDADHYNPKFQGFRREQAA